MDALPISEKTGLPFSSLHDGCSHSCGHDFELAWGLMVAKYFAANPMKGCLRLIFQPAEEGPGAEPHGKTGGQLLHELGVFKADSIMSLHVEPELQLGNVSIAGGEVTCTAYDFEYVLTGKASHAAKPHQGINPVPVAADLTRALLDLVARLRADYASDEDFVLLSVSDIATQLSAGEKNTEGSVNTIPELAFVRGITRVRGTTTQERLLAGLKEIEVRFATGLKDCRLELRHTAVATVNDRAAVQHVVAAAAEFNIPVVAKRTTWRDDAGWASLSAASAHGFVGIDDGKPAALHSPDFIANEGALPIGLKLFVSSLERRFSEGVQQR